MMKNALKFIACCTLLLAAHPVAGQEAGGDAEEAGKVEYFLIKPDEKTSELVKDDEHNPFEAPSDAKKDQPSTSEENQVRDLLLSLPVVGVSPGQNGMRVLLGDIRLEAGTMVPQVIPNQNVQLRVNNVTADSIELVWVEKKPTGLPPRLLVIPIDTTPKVQYQLKGSAGRNGMAPPVSTSRSGMPLGQQKRATPYSSSASMGSRARSGSSRATPVEEKHSTRR